MLDIAPNHTGSEHPMVPGGAGRRRTRRPADYFIFRERPDDYDSWLGVRSLPKLDYRDPGLRDAMYAGADAVLRRWLRPPFSVDGWRIDVANMLGRLGPDQLGAEVARGMRDAVKEENPEAYLIGEHSFDASEQLAGDQWDGVMNYAGFHSPVLAWLNGARTSATGRARILRAGPTPTTDMVETLGAFRAGVPWAVLRCQYNLLDSHDTARIRTAVGGDAGPAPGGVRDAAGYVGVPSILYGDEVGLEGSDGLSTRRTMPWDPAAWDGEQLAFVRTLVRLRRGSRALQVGGFQVLDVGDDCLAFLRDTRRGGRRRRGRPRSGVSAGWAVATSPGEPWRTGPSSSRSWAAPVATVSEGHLAVPSMAPGVAIWTAATP